MHYAKRRKRSQTQKLTDSVYSFASTSEKAKM